MNTKILCCYHRKAPRIMNKLLSQYPDIFVPILGGSIYYKQGTDSFFDTLQRDDTGDNASVFDLQFSEHTCLYWMYRHLRDLNDPDIVGLCHYRRFMDVDYTNLDPTKIYLRRDPNLRPESIRDVVTTWAGLPTLELTMDDFLYHYPEYKTAVDVTLTAWKFFDKNMFIMPRLEFVRYMEYLVRCYRFLTSQAFTMLLVRWCSIHPDISIGRCIVHRGIAFLLEMFSSIYFQKLQIDGHPIVITTCTKDSFNEY